MEMVGEMGKVAKRFYATRRARHTEQGKKFKTVYMHREILKTGLGMVVDHINGNALDNRRCNLREVTQRQNQQNRIKATSSKYPGVTWHKRDKIWTAAANINGQRKNLGTFYNEIDAFIAYRKAVNNLGEELLKEWQELEVSSQ